VALAWSSAPQLFAAVLLTQVVEAVAVVASVEGVHGVTSAVLVRSSDGSLDAASVVPSGVVLLVATMVVAACQCIQPALAAMLGERLAVTATSDVLDVAGRMALSDFDRPDVLDRLKRCEVGALVRPGQLAVGLGALLSGTVGAVALLLAVLSIQPWLAAAGIAAAVPLWWAARRDGAQAYESVRGLSRLERRRMYLAGLLTRREHAAEVRALDLAPEVLRRYRALGDERYPEVRRLALERARRQLFARATGGTLLLGAFAVLGAMLVTGHISLADATAAAAAGAALRARLADTSMGVRQTQEAAEFVDDHRQLLAGAHVPTATTLAADPHPRRLELRLEGVCFTYLDAPTPALRGVDVTLRSGEVVALVGANGSGKSTLATVAAGLLPPTAGRVVWNGQDLQGLAADQWRRDVALLPQRPGRYDETLRDNVAFGATHRRPDDTVVERALLGAGAGDILRRANHDLDTALGREQDGVLELSGGQWQRIALARTFYRGGRLLILDEPTAPLDPVAEHDLVDRLRGSFADRAVLMITHRMAAARAADHVVVLDAGRVVEQGPPDALLATGGAFAHLCATQADLWAA
jgi:ATP-binding cassette subfamily B protein